MKRIIIAIIVVFIALAFIRSRQGFAAAPGIRVSIEILPGEGSKVVDASLRRTAPVAILSSPEFDAASVNPASVRLAGAPVTKAGNAKLRGLLRDVDGDGRRDLVVEVSAFSLRLNPGVSEASLTAITFDGQPVTGSQRIVYRAFLPGKTANGPLAPLSGVFTNTTRIAINDSFTPPTTASLYPSTIDVQGQGALSKITVTISGLNHTFVDDVDILLVGPTGVSCLLMADCGGSNFIHGVDLTFDDDAPSPLPDGTFDGTIVTGAYRPTKGTSFGDDNSVPVCGFPSPAPNNGAACPGNPFAYSTTLSVFNGTSPNGTWRLYVIDDTGGDDGSIEGGWSLTITAPTEARMLSGEATVLGDGRVLVKWRTGFESDNLGFNVYREQNGELVRANEQLIAGSALIAGPATALTAGHLYRWQDRLQNASEAARYWLEDVSVNGVSSWHGPVDTSISNERTDSEFDQPVSPTLAELDHRDSAGAGKPEVTAALSTTITSAVKLAVKRDGYYRVTQPELAAGGFDPGVDPRFLQLTADGRQQAISVKPGKDGRFDSSASIEFYGTASRAAYTGVHAYRLAAGSQPGLRIPVAPETAATGTSDSFLYTSELREKTIYFSALRNGDRENFFGSVVTTQPVDQTLRLVNVWAKARSEATIEVVLQGVTQTPHIVRLFLNGADVGLVSFEGQASGAARISIQQQTLREGSNTVRLLAQGGASDVSLVDAIRISYWHSFTADDNVLRLGAAAGQKLTIGGFTRADVKVLDITDAESGDIREVAATRSSTPGASSVSFTAPGTGERQLFVLAHDQAKEPAAITPDYPSAWRQPANAADLVIITRRDFLPAVAALKSWRESQGLRVAVADIEDVFDEFNHGNKSPQAIKDFLRYAKTNWKIAPRFALFVGDSSYDPKNYLGYGDWDLVPAKLIDTAFMETASDDWFADFNGDGLPDMAVGRLPVRTLEEARTVISKIIGYDWSIPSPRILLVADENDGFDFEHAIGALRALVPRSIAVSEIDRGNVSDSSAKSRLLEAINRGQKLVNYAGHGNSDRWRGDLLTSSDALTLSNSGSLSVFISMTCLNGYFQDPATTSLGEALLKAPNGGAVAVLASSGLSDPASQTAVNRVLYLALLSGEHLTLGEATVKAKAGVADRDLRGVLNLLGDPATRLR